MNERMPVIRRSTILIAATAFGVSSTMQAYLLERFAAHPEGPSSILGLFVLNIVYWYVPALLAPTIMALSLRYHSDRTPVRIVALVHLAGVFAYSVLHIAVMLATRWLLHGLHILMDAPTPSWWEYARHLYLEQLDWLLMTYLFLVGLAYALAYRRDSEEGALNAARLETRVVEAQLRALQHELHPHFLFNTLNTISALMRTNVDAADATLDRLADLLRMTLRASGTEPVPLRRELAMLEKYLQIEQMRFGDRLAVALDVDGEAMGALVPNFLLQPLVENAVRHGVAPHGRPGSVSIRASRDGEALTVRIQDSGNGASPDRLASRSGGIGLANTRARLEHLYPAAHRFEFENVPGGFLVTISIPYQTEALEALEAAEEVAQA
jgi:two-component system, LytTR family, sensor kinase